MVTKKRYVSRSKLKILSKSNKVSSSRKHLINSRKNSTRHKNMDGGSNNPIQYKKILKDYKIIRIFITGGAGFGNQRSSLTLMYKLRLLGFIGIFEIRYKDIYPANIALSQYTYKNEPHTVFEIERDKGQIGISISILIPEFKPDTEYDPKNQKTFDIYSETFGSLTITRLPYLPISFDKQTYNLPKTEITMCGANDQVGYYDHQSPGGIDIGNRMLYKFNTQIYCSCIPTDWDTGERFLITDTGIFKRYDINYRLSSEQLFYYTSNKYEDSIKKLLKNAQCYSQLVYGLNNAKFFLPIQTVVYNLLSALTQLTQLTITGYILLLFPQDIFKDIDISDKKFNNIVSIVSNIDGFIPEITTPHKIYLLYIDKLRPSFFDDLMVNLTTLPPVIEGCSSIETCESNARLYLHSSRINTKINDYGKSQYSKTLQLHKLACSPLEKNVLDNIKHTTNFLSMFLEKKLLEYSKQRQTDHLARPDIIVTMLREIMIL